MSGPELRNLNVASEFLAVSKANIYGMAARGEIELVRLGGRTLIRQAEIERISAAAQPWQPDEARVAKAKAARAKRRSGGER